MSYYQLFFSPYLLLKQYELGTGSHWVAFRGHLPRSQEIAALEEAVRATHARIAELEVTGVGTKYSVRTLKRSLLTSCDGHYVLREDFDNSS